MNALLIKLESRLLARFLLCLLVVALVCLPLRAHAQQVSLSLSPPHLESVMKPGKSILIAYTIENHSDPTILTASVRPMQAMGQKGATSHKSELDGPIEFALDNAQFALGDSFFLTGREKQQLLLRIKVPESTPEGDYYYTLFVRTEPSTNVEGSVAPRATASVGSHILITVTETGAVDLKGRISFFDTIGGYFGIFDSFAPIPVRLTVENTGRNLVKAQGNLTLRGNFGETARYDILPQNILAHSSRNILATPSASLDCSGDHARSNGCKNGTSLVLSGFFVGRYALASNVHFGDGAPATFENVVFWALPFRLIFGLGFAVLIALVAWKKFRADGQSTTLPEDPPQI